MNKPQPRRLRMTQATAVPSTMATFGRGQMAFYNQHGFATDFLSSKGDGLDIVCKEGVEYFEMDFRRALSPVADAKTIWRLWRYLRQHKPTVLQLKTLKPGVLGTIAGRLARVPVIIRYKQGYMRESNIMGIRRAIMMAVDRVANRLAHRVVCVCHELREAEIAAGAVAPDKIVVYGAGSSHGIDVDRFTLTKDLAARGRAIRADLGISPDETVLGTMMRINIEKGISELVEAFGQVAEQRVDVHLIVVGDYDIRNVPPEHVKRALIEHPRIHLVGWQHETPPYYAAMDIFVLPTYREGLCNSNLEANCMGRPVISTRIIGVDGSSAIDGETALLVPPRESRALADAMKTLLDDRALAERLGRIGRERVTREFASQLVWHRQLRDICELLEARGIEPPVRPEQIAGATCPRCRV
jgi:glycosyltransferase involved in cell wall biosynthesis